MGRPKRPLPSPDDLTSITLASLSRDRLTVTCAVSAALADGTPHTERLTLLCEDEADLPPLAAGAPLSPETLARLRRLDAKRATLRAALDRLGRGAYSAARLCERLTAGGATREDAVCAVRACIRLGYLREKEQIADVCRRMYDDGRGPRRITAKCLCDGYRAADVEAVLAEAERSGQIDFAARRRELAALWRSRGLTETEIQKKLAAAGFAYEDE